MHRSCCDKIPTISTHGAPLETTEVIDVKARRAIEGCENKAKVKYREPKSNLPQGCKEALRCH